MFIHNINPTLIKLGIFEIRFYGLVYALGFLAVFFLLRHYSRKKKLKLNYDEIDTLLLYLILGVLIGSRLFEMIFWNFSYYLANPVRLLYFWEGGMSFHGGFVGVIFAGWLFVRKHKAKVTFMELADILAIPAMFFLALGRVANFINAELVGKITDVSWCVKFPSEFGCRHPYQIYSALARFSIFVWLFYLGRKSFRAGFIFWNFMLFDGIARFILDFYKDFDSTLLGLTAGQYLSLVMIILSSYFLYSKHRKDFTKVFI